MISVPCWNEILQTTKPIKGKKLCKSLFCKQLALIDIFEMSTAFQASSSFGCVATLQKTGGQNTELGEIGSPKFRKLKLPDIIVKISFGYEKL